MKIFLILFFSLFPLTAHASMAQALQSVQQERYQDALKEFLRPTHKANPLANYWIGNLHFYGLGVKQDTQAALKWLHKSARLEHAPAMTLLGVIHLSGRTGIIKPKLARGWFEKASKKGELFALLKMGEIYTSGLGVPANPKIGMRYVKKAAKAGSLEAQFILAQAHLKGIGVKKDPRQALFWLKRSATNQHAPSIELLKELEKGHE